jgi:hypothetical protein
LITIVAVLAAAPISAPRTARFITLHTTVRDSEGNSVDRRIDRAFGLR